MKVEPKSTIKHGFVYPGGRKMKAKDGIIKGAGDDVYILLKGLCFGGGTPTSGIVTE